ncbi:MAG: hypothetical protein JJU36_14250 [Phycisphaeraceae bacterium]|nr:hypothetical protein [Phycisphaeraceae bacterium]
MSSRLFPRLLALAALLPGLHAVPSYAIVLHEPVYTGQVPPDAWIGKWGNYASAVAIDPNFVLVSRHQSGGIGTVVTIADVAYQVVEKFEHGSADLAVARIIRTDGAPAMLPTWAPLHSNDEHGQDWGRGFVMGGYGSTTGQELFTSSGEHYGYQWGAKPQDVVWGANTIDRVIFKIPGNSYFSNGLQAQFDGPESAEAVPGEAIGAGGDSGGGWFLHDPSAGWSLAGLTVQVQTGGESRFADPITAAPAPDLTYAVRINNYRTWINNILATFQPMPGDVDLDGLIEHNDLLVVQEHLGKNPASWQTGDFTGNNRVSLRDAFLLMENFTGIVPAKGDANVDGHVDHEDLAILQVNLGRQDSNWYEGDFTRDHRVGLRDAFVLFENFTGILPLPGDADSNGVVDDIDLAIVQANLGMEGAAWADGDFSHDGRVTLRDAFMLAENYSPPAPPLPLPEPAAGSILAFLAWWLHRRPAAVR